MSLAPSVYPARPSWIARQLNALYSLYVWAVWILLLVLAGPLAIVALLIDRRLGFKIVKAISYVAFGLAGIRVTIRGRESVDWRHAHVFMGNHQNLLDPFVLVMAVRYFLVGIEKRENLKLPVYGMLTRAWGNLPIDRGNAEAARETIAQATERLKAGMSIAILPEGTRSKDGSIGAFKKGGFHLALDAGADIVPFTVNGAYDRLRTGSWRISPGPIEFVFSEAIATEGYTKETMDDLIVRVREAIVANYTG